MNRILIVAATYPEIQFLEKLNLKPVSNSSHDFEFKYSETTIDVLITGVGMVATTFQLTKHLSKNNYDFILNIGIAGAFDRKIELGEVVEIINDCFIETGADDGEDFISIFKLGLQDSNEFPFQNCILKNDFKLNCLTALKKVNAITVNKVNGNTAAIEKLTDRLKSDNYIAQTESMEGAAFFYTCFQFKIACIQLRAVSNYIEKRNRAAWKIKESLINLEKATLEILNALVG